MVKVHPSNSRWLFSTIYASLRSVERQILWNNLMQVADLHNMPWVLTGDFNEPLLKDDKFGGQAMNVNRALLFKECLNKCVRAKNEVSRPVLTWAHNLFVIWALDFLLWVVPSTETRQSNLS